MVGTDARSSGPSASRSFVVDRVTVTLIVAHVGVAFLLAVWRPVPVDHGDIGRFVQIAATPGIPYRQFEVEYPPLETVLIEVLFGDSIGQAIALAAALSLICGLGAFVVIRSTWGPLPAMWFLLFGLPMQVFMPFRLDLVGIVLAIGAAAAAVRSKQRLAGTLFAGAILFKLWPLVLLPALLLSGRRRAFVWACVGSGVGLAGWVAFGGIDPVRYVASFRGSSGWQVESSVGAVLAVLGHPMRTELGALRVGEVSDWARALLVVALLALEVAVWSRARTNTVYPFGFPAAAAVAALVAVSPVSSSQYVAWFTPWAAIAAAGSPRRGLFTATMVASSASAMAYVIYWGVEAQDLLAWIALVRALAIGSVPVLWLWGSPVATRTARPRSL